MPGLVERGKIDNVLTEGNADARHTGRRLENAKWKILQREMRISWDLDERLERHDGRDAALRRPGHRSAMPLPYNKFKARKSSRGSSKLQLPNDTTNVRRYCSRLMSIFHSRHAKNSSVKENESAFSSSSMTAVWSAFHRCSAARTAAPSTFRKPYILVWTSFRYRRSGWWSPAVNLIGT